jgi:hypothetical protein
MTPTLVTSCTALNEGALAPWGGPASLKVFTYE